VARPIARKIVKNLLVMRASLTKPGVRSQRFPLVADLRLGKIGEISPCHDSTLSSPGRNLKTIEPSQCLRYNRAGMLDMFLGCLKWAAVGFIVAFALMKLFEASHIHDDIPKPAFKIRQTKRATFVLSTFAAMLSALVWLLVQKLD
jgi:hypothetical protein